MTVEGLDKSNEVVALVVSQCKWTKTGYYVRCAFIASMPKMWKGDPPFPRYLLPRISSPWVYCGMNWKPLIIHPVQIWVIIRIGTVSTTAQCHIKSLISQSFQLNYLVWLQQWDKLWPIPIKQHLEWLPFIPSCFWTYLIYTYYFPLPSTWCQCLTPRWLILL